MLVVFADALALLHRFTPEYLPWIDRTVHQLFLLSPRPSKVESGSVEHYLGLVHLTAHGEPLPVAELLLHEATHQYMNVLAKLQPLDDGTDDRLYWSPAVETDRPVSKIIAAFHAFGNVLLFYRWCRERGLPNAAECDRQEALLGGWMEHLVPPVVDNPAITDTGNALCQPLLEMLGLP
jgi:HEXXH motif-containing protein